MASQLPPPPPQQQQQQHGGSFSLFPNAQAVRPLPPTNTVPRLNPHPKPRHRANAQVRTQTPAEQPQDPVISPLTSTAETPSQARSPTPLQFDLVSQTDITSPDAGPSEASHARSTSRSSIAKPPIVDETPGQPQAFQSIFPTYNPDIPLDRQPYGPVHTEPAAVPRAVLSRQSYYDPDEAASNYHDSHRARSPPARLDIPMTAFSNRQVVGRAVTTTEAPVIPKTSTSDELRGFWKAANGWKASSSEGKVFCMRMTQLKDAPVYTLSSTTQPLYNMRLDPTSASANVTLSRHDPSKAYKPGKGEGSATESKHWQTALATTLEAESRKYPPNDGLVATLMPTPAARMAMIKADDPAAVEMAERENARLVWDHDSGCHYVVHHALAAPFCVTVEKAPAWSRTEYTLEHHESPRHLAKLTKDGTGGGWLEVDTTVASQIESYYIIDVAVAALLLVAAADNRNSPSCGGAVETFAPPPAVAGGSGRASRMSRFSNKDASPRDKKKPKKKKSATRMEEFEMDLESQDDSLGKGVSAQVKELEDGLPFLLRVVVKLIKGVFKLVIWILTLAFKILARCFGSKY